MAEFHDKDVGIEEGSMLNEVDKIWMVFNSLMDFDFVEEEEFVCFGLEKVFLNNFESKLIFYLEKKLLDLYFFAL